MIVRPGRKLLIMAAAVAVIALFAFWWGPILWLAGVSLIVIAVLAARDALHASKLLGQIKTSRTLPAVVGRDLPFPVEFVIRSEGSETIQGELREVLPPECRPVWCAEEFQLAASGETKLSFECRIPVRGRFRFGPTWIRVEGGLGLAEVQKQFDCWDDIKVLPETFASRGELQKDLNAQVMLQDKLNRARQQGTGSEFVMLDEFRRGDDPRRVDWRATAKHGYPIVRRYQVERHRDVLILIDCGRLMGSMTDRGSKLDCAVDAALNLSRVALESGDRCGIGFFDSTVRGYLRPVAGPNSLKNLVDCVYDLRSQFRETDFSRVFAEIQRRQAKRCFLVVLSDLGDAETSRMHCAALERLHRRHLVLFAALRTPLLNRVIHEEVRTVQDGARKVVAMGLCRDRSRSLHSLRHGGVRILDVEPQQLVLPLVNRFIELRQQNLL